MTDGEFRMTEETSIEADGELLAQAELLRGFLSPASGYALPVNVAGSGTNIIQLKLAKTSPRAMKVTNFASHQTGCASPLLHPAGSSGDPDDASALSHRDPARFTDRGSRMEPSLPHDHRRSALLLERPDDRLQPHLLEQRDHQKVYRCPFVLQNEQSSHASHR
ncbi:MAG: hypothetical protein IPI01_03950 [Ignavibacteriae bacterium]|nr:hypothetical protein [Ignavibacteriota bacterium]